MYANAGREPFCLFASAFRFISAFAFWSRVCNRSMGVARTEI